MKTTLPQMKSIDRLRKRADFLRVGGSGRKWVTPTMVVQVAEREVLVPHPGPLPKRGRASDGACGVDQVRYGLTVPKKIWPKAVDRNRVRRRVRAAVLGVLAEQGEWGIDLVILPRAPARTADFEALQKDFRWALRRLTSKAGGDDTPPS